MLNVLPRKKETRSTIDVMKELKAEAQKHLKPLSKMSNPKTAPDLKSMQGTLKQAQNAAKKLQDHCVVAKVFSL